MIVEIEQKQEFGQEMQMRAETGRDDGQNDCPYHFRRLNAGDIWPMVAILSKIGIREISRLESVQRILFPPAVQVKRADAISAASHLSGQDQEAEYSGVDAMFDIIGLALEKLPDCKKDIYSLLARVTGMTESEIDKLDFGIFAGMVIDFCKKDELQDFIKAASKLLK